MRRRNWGILVMVIAALPAAAQQTGAITGKVTSKDGKGLAGVQVEATSSVMPQPRRVVTGETGEYRMPFLPPGEYILTFTHADLATAKRGAGVFLQQTTTVNVAMAKATTAGATVEVVGEKGALVDATSAELKASVSSEVINALPVGQDYRDLIKLMPGVMYTQDTVRAPSAGGSGQDNIHQFDGVNVNLPLFGTLSSQPSGHDLDQITIIKGGADATGFNRSAGYTVNSISKSGTNFFTGELSYQILPDHLVAKRRIPPGAAAVYEQEKTYAIANVGGPILADKLFFFASLYRPTIKQQNSSNNYGPTPDLSYTRNEYFGKLTYAPTADILIHGSFRDSDETTNHSGYDSPSRSPTTGQGAKSTTKTGILEATWNLTPNSFLHFRTSNYINKNGDNPDYRSSALASFSGSLDVNALDTQGWFTVPTPLGGTNPNAAQQAYNAFIAPLIAKYGYISPTTGLPTGSGTVGGYYQINNQNFFRRSYELAYDAVWGTEVTHTFHAGAQWTKEIEDLYRISNGWGQISAAAPLPSTVYPPLSPNLRLPYYFVAAVNQQGISGVPTIHSEYEALNYELNDKIKWRNFTFNVGLVLSKDKMYGSGLRPDSSTVSGYVLARGNKYLEKEISFSDTLQPRLGVTWNYHADDTVYANWSRFVPAVSSLPRAASWDRNLAATVNVYFNATGQQVDHQTDFSSTGKFFTPGIKPRHTDEWLVGTTRDLGKGWSGRAYARYRHSVDFWEDTNNGARVMFATPDWVPKAYYIPELYLWLNQLDGGTRTQAGTNSTFVIAQLDNSFTKYYEVCLEAEWKSANAYANLSYSWSHYYGNFDQDNSTTTLANDSNIFIGSSNIADDFGRQLWNNKYGNLAGDRRHKLKAFGTYNLPWWSGRVGAYFIFQSGQPWQFSDYTVYTADKNAQGSSSTSNTNRYAEPAGSHTTSSHHQMDLNYTHSFLKSKRFKLEAMVDIYNVYNRQTGYNIQTSVSGTNPGMPQTFYQPRRTQLGVRFLF